MCVYLYVCLYVCVYVCVFGCGGCHMSRSYRAQGHKGTHCPWGPCGQPGDSETPVPLNLGPPGAQGAPSNPRALGAMWAL